MNSTRKLFEESKEILQSRSFRKWRSMKARNLQLFATEHPQTFLRRMRRGVPHAFRWEVWKVHTQLDTLIEGTDCTEVLKLYPPIGSNWLAENNSDEEPLIDVHSLAQGKTPAQLFDELKSTKSRFASLIDIDVARTFPEVSAFDKQAQQQLHNVLNAYANFAPQVGYCQGMNFVGGFIMLVSGLAPEEEIFYFFAILMQRYDLHGFFRERFPLLESYLRAFDELSECYCPELRGHFIHENVMPPVYLHQWYLTMFVTSLPLGTVAVVWDFIVCVGLHAVLPVTLALLKVLQSFLLRLKFEGIVRFMRSLRSSGDCDESKIGKMLISQAENFRVLDKFKPLVIDIDWNILLADLPSQARVEKRRSVTLVDFPAPSSGDGSKQTLIKICLVADPLNVAMADCPLGDDDDDDDVGVSIAAPAPAAVAAATNRSSNRSRLFLPRIMGGGRKS